MDLRDFGATFLLSSNGAPRLLPPPQVLISTSWNRGLYALIVDHKRMGCLGNQVMGSIDISVQFITTLAEVTPNGGLVREIPLFQGNLGW